jgi:hypothetical protein
MVHPQRNLFDISLSPGRIPFSKIIRFQDLEFDSWRLDPPAKWWCVEIQAKQYGPQA